jgi:hypothetical protein
VFSSKIKSKVSLISGVALTNLIFLYAFIPKYLIGEAKSPLKKLCGADSTSSKSTTIDFSEYISGNNFSSRYFIAPSLSSA